MASVSQLIKAVALFGKLDEQNVAFCARDLVNNGLLPKSAGSAIAQVDALNTITLLIAAAVTQRPTHAAAVANRFLPLTLRGDRSKGAKTFGVVAQHVMHAMMRPDIEQRPMKHTMITLDPLIVYAKIERFERRELDLGERETEYYCESVTNVAEFEEAMERRKRIQQAAIIPDSVLQDIAKSVSPLPAEAWDRFTVANSVWSGQFSAGSDIAFASRKDRRKAK